ncbi:uncharacterized protein MAM_00234 [Metarhizium album ARSEF 1941]|uniref:Acyl-CoA thioesterase n=1 Tax=Metarhizium album (strain ARSEF 1941) TaxID=1081103 RepID=A0A0B2X649_METAS|nr:uncharacterized protein MAM_00234 [Metarhizium album ARSEF 1941]KHO01233.1 hypothetical protein MAM_00234 [Metarhizium album ARSEF 1941]
MTDRKGAMAEFEEALEEIQQRVLVSHREWPRMDFDAFMELVQVPSETHRHGAGVKRYMSRQPAWMPGSELPWDAVLQNWKGPRPRHSGPGVFGGCVYAQAPLAAARAVEEEERQQTAATGVVKPVPGIHSIQGIFTTPGLPDRPFVFDVTDIISGRSFFGRQVTVRQPKQPSSHPAGPFPGSDAKLPLHDVCFSCITTFKRPVEGVDDVQSPISAQKRYADILSQRAPAQWEPAPQSDIEAITSLFKGFKGHGGFPLLDMYKVDMSEYNSDKEVPDRVQLMLYRPMKPVPKDDVNGHIVCHAFAADRNGLVMLANHMGYGFSMGLAASLSYSFYIHTNPGEAVMDGEEWWIQEISWPRVSANRCMMESKTWSPEGKHIASAYQDGILAPAREPAKVKEPKL